MNYYILEPEVPGFGVIQNGSDVIMVVEIPPNDDLLAEDNYFFISERLNKRIKSEMLTGFFTKPVKAVLSEQRKQFSPDLALPDYYLLNIDGHPGVNDFGLLDHTDLIVSSRALDTLREFKLSKCDISEFC
jgi:hypothetical protein